MTKVEIVAEQLKNEILSGVHPVGSKLPSESQLCEQYSVSRLTVRGALNLLNAWGLAETEKGRGTFVASGKDSVFSDISRLDMFEFRRIIEAESAGLAAQRADSGIIEKMYAAVHGMESSVRSEDVVYYDGLFHDLIAEATKNVAIARVYKLMDPMFEKMFQQNISVLGTEGYRDHLKILTAIEARNPDLARSYMLEHLNSTMEKTSILNYDGGTAPKK